MKNSTKGDIKVKIIKKAAPVLIGFGISLLLLLISALILNKTEIPDRYYNVCSIISAAAGAFACGIIASKTANEKKFFFGIAETLLFAAVLALIAFFIINDSQTPNFAKSAIRYLIVAASGTVGSFLGTKRKIKRFKKH